MRYKFPGLILCCLFLAVRANAALRLTYATGDRKGEVTSVARNHVTAEDGNKTFDVPAEAFNDGNWHLEGEIRENAASICWSPSYTLWSDTPSVDGKPHITASVSITHQIERNGRAVESPFLQSWPSGLANPALVVFAWIVHGNPTQVHVATIPSTKVNLFRAHAKFDLSGEELSGQAIVLVWSEGKFVSPAPRYKSPIEQAAFIATELDDVDALQAALANGTSVSAKCRDGVPLLQYAAEAGSARCLELLLTKGAKPGRKRGPDGALLWAVEKNRVEIVRRLLAAKAQPNADEGTDGALIVALRLGLEDIALILIDKGAETAAIASNRMTPITTAIDGGLVRATTELLGRDAEIDFHDEQTARALITQARRGHRDMVRFLLSHGVAADLVADNVTPLIAGAILGDASIAEALLAKRVDVNRQMPNGQTALITATYANSVNYVRVLLERGAKPDLAMHDGATALHLASSTNASDIAQLLIAHGADMTLQSKNGSPLHVALAAEARETASVLARAGAKLNVQSPAISALISRAIAYDLAPVVRAALNDGWSRETKFAGDWTPMALAVIYASKQCVDVLHAAADAANERSVVDVRTVSTAAMPTEIVPATDPRNVDEPYSTAVVSVDVLVDMDGTPRFPRVAETPIAALGAPATEAVRKWKFKPALADGRAVATILRVPVSFESSEATVAYAWNVDVPPVVVSRPELVYPRDAAGVQGAVEVEFIVNADGRPDPNHIRATSSPNPELERAAVNAVKTWVFKPALINGMPVRSRVATSVVFQVEDYHGY